MDSRGVNYSVLQIEKHIEYYVNKPSPHDDVDDVTSSITATWWSKFNVLNSEQRKKIELIISENKFIDIDIDIDSLVIRRSFTLNDLKNVIKKSCILEKKDDNFALNYLVLAKKRGIKNAELFDILIQNLQEEEIENFMLVGDEYESYFVNADKYIIITKDEKTYISSDEPITIFDLFQKFKDNNIKLTKNFLTTLLKHWKISTLNNSGNEVLFPLSIFNALQGFVEYKEKGIFCYLFNGSWYAFDETYDKLLLQEYK